MPENDTFFLISQIRTSHWKKYSRKWVRAWIYTLNEKELWGATLRLDMFTENCTRVSNEDSKVMSHHADVLFIFEATKLNFAVTES